LNGKDVLALLGQFSVLHEPLEGTSRFVIDLDFFGADPGFGFEFLGGHEEIKQGNQGSIDGGQEGLFLKALKPVAADIFTDDREIFLFHETVIVFPVVPAGGEGEECIGVPDFGGMIDKFRAIVARKLCFRWNSKTGRGTVILMSGRALKVQGWAVLRRERSSTQPEETSVAVNLWTYWRTWPVRNGVGLKSAGDDLPETGLFPLLAGGGYGLSGNEGVW
jgi:hypothetical protein